MEKTAAEPIVKKQIVEHIYKKSALSIQNKTNETHIISDKCFTNEEITRISVFIVTCLIPLLVISILQKQIEN